MSFADTARLISSLELQDKFSGPAAAAEKSLGGLEQKSNFVQKGFGIMGQAVSGVGGAFSTLKGRIGQLISGPLGMLGLGAGLFSVFGLIKGGIEQAGDFAKEVGRLAAVTGLSTDSTSRLAGAFHHFGIETDTALAIAGMAEKNLFKLGGTTKAADKFLEKYGFSLVDSSGKLKDFNSLLLDTSDFFKNAQIPAATKAAALAAIYGKNWQALIPILGAGRVAISDAEEEAQALGLTLTKDNLASLSKLKTATRDWGTALGGLKLQLGLAVVPLLTDLTTGATNFLKTTDEFGRTGSQRIVGFFKDLIDFGKQAFGVIENQVVPVVKKVIEGWNDLPAPLKGLLVKGVSGNFAIKFLLGFDPVAIAGAAGAAVAGKLAGTVAGAFGSFIGDFFGRTAAQKLIPQVVVPASGALPVFVTNPGFGLPTGGPGAAPTPVPTPGGTPWWTTALRLLGITGIALGVGELAGQSNVNTDTQVQMLRQQLIATGDVKASLDKSGATLGAINELLADPDLRAGLSPEILKALDAIDGKIGDVVTNTKPLTQTGGRHGPEGPTPPKPLPLDDAALIAALAKTSEFGGLGGTTIEHGPLLGTDPFGEQALRLFERAEFPKQGQTLGEIERHIIAAEEVQAAYLKSGDLNSAQRTQAVIDGMHRLLGSTDQTVPALDRVQATLDSLPFGLGAQFSKLPPPSVKVNVDVDTRISVSNVARTLLSNRIAGTTTLGGFTASAFE